MITSSIIISTCTPPNSYCSSQSLLEINAGMATKFSSTSKVRSVESRSYSLSRENISILWCDCACVCVYLSMVLNTQEINVSYEDQMRICQFARKNARLVDIQEQISSKEVSVSIDIYRTQSSIYDR